MTHIVGYIAIVGSPNAGKSTLINSIVEQKVSIVGPKPHTTRDSILGIWSEDNCQMIFVDTPGTVRPQNLLGDYMKKSIDRAIVDVDCILLVIDGHKGISDKELAQAEKYASKGIPLVIAVSKTDISQPEKLMPQLAKLNGLQGVDAVFAISARKNKNIPQLKEYLKRFLKEGEPYYPQDEVTNRSLRFMVCEQIREKIMLVLDCEVPYGIGVELNKMETNDNGKWIIDANIYVDKASHKPILLGKNGEMIKQISIHSRKGIKKLLQSEVYLELWVKVKPNWRDSKYMVSQIGYNPDDV